MRVSWRLGVAACFCLMVSVALLARNPIRPQQAPGQASAAPDVPTVNGGAGDCSADFTVIDAGGKAVYDAKIHIMVKYGFLGAHHIDAVVGTNSDGKARIVGLPIQIKGIAEFTISHGDQSKTLPYEPLNECHSKHDVTLGGK